jgi:uncharacterized membrane protein YbhN (UPF0104 family)
MPTPDPSLSVSSKRLRDWLIGGLVLCALIWWLDHYIGWQPLLAPWRDFVPLELLGLLTLSFVSYLLRAVRIYDYFRARLGGQFLLSLRLSVLHNVANNLLPMRTGEAAFPILMRRYFGQGMAESLLSLLWIRVLDLHLLLGMALAVLWLRQMEWLWFGVLLAWLGALLLVYPLQRPLLAWLAGRTGRLWKLAGKILGTLPQSQGLFLRIYLWTLLIWLAKIAAFIAVLLHFLPIPLWQGLLGVMGAELSSILPVHGIAGAGSYELAMTAVLVPLGIEAKAAMQGAVNLHLFLLGVTLLLGLAALLLPGPQRRCD